MQQRKPLAAGKWVAAALFMTYAFPAAAQAPAAGLVWMTDPTSKCEFIAPVSLTAGPTYWIGECPNNKATGLGMLRRRDGDRAGPAFYGEMHAGVPVIGVIDNEGYRVGKFKNGDIGGDTELEAQVRLDAFREAAKAAREVGVRYAKQGNSPSARYYDGIARQLDVQIE